MAQLHSYNGHPIQETSAYSLRGSITKMELAGDTETGKNERTNESAAVWTVFFVSIMAQLTINLFLQLTVVKLTAGRPPA